MIDIFEEHQADRDKFQMIAFHDGSVKNFKELDEKLVAIKKQYWQNKDLPFPILLDASGETIKTFGLSHFPTTLLINPEGKLVGEVTAGELEKHLPEISTARRITKALDKNVVFQCDDTPLAAAIKMLTLRNAIPVRIDGPSLKEAGIDPEAKIPFKMTGQVSLRSALNLILSAYDLTFDVNEKEIIIRAKKKGEQITSTVSERQRNTNEAIEQKLQGKTTFDLQDKTLAEIAQHFEAQTQENFVLEPAARRAGALDPQQKVSGIAKDVSLSEGLKKLLDPAGMKIVVRDEVVVITPKSNK